MNAHAPPPAHVCRAAAPGLAEVERRLVRSKAVARLLNCSERHVWRLANRGAMPAAVHLGALVRWDRAAVLAWIAGGCQPVRQGVQA